MYEMIVRTSSSYFAFIIRPQSKQSSEVIFLYLEVCRFGSGWLKCPDFADSYKDDIK